MVVIKTKRSSWSVLKALSVIFVCLLVNVISIDLKAQSYFKRTFIDSIDNIQPAGGVGFRYLLAKQFGLYLGLDFAHGPEQFVWYLTFGSNWFR